MVEDCSVYNDCYLPRGPGRDVTDPRADTRRGWGPRVEVGRVDLRWGSDERHRKMLGRSALSIASRQAYSASRRSARPPCRPARYPRLLSHSIVWSSNMPANKALKVHGSSRSPRPNRPRPTAQTQSAPLGPRQWRCGQPTGHAPEPPYGQARPQPPGVALVAMSRNLTNLSEAHLFSPVYQLHKCNAVLMPSCYRPVS